MNSYFASVEQQANPGLQGKPVGVTGGDRLERTVLCTASIEAKKAGVKTGMQIWEAKKICPNLIIVCSDHEKYLSVTTKFLNIFKDYTPYLEIFSIDEVFLELRPPNDDIESARKVAQEIKQRLKEKIGERITCSIGISYNKLLAKLAGSLQKPDGLVVIRNQQEAIKILDKVSLDDICGIGVHIKKRLFNLGVTNFYQLRQVPKELLTASFKSYGETLYNFARGLDHTPIIPFYQKEEVKSIGHRHTLNCDTGDSFEIKQLIFKISEMVAKRLREKNLLGKTVHCWYRSAHLPGVFLGDGKQQSLGYFTCDGWEIFQKAWQIFFQIWDGGKIRMVGLSISNLQSADVVSLSLFVKESRRQAVCRAIDKLNNKFGDFTLQRATLLQSEDLRRKPNPFLSDRRFRY
ncbi:MAG: DNA polymerase IV [Patescibacteria group bacterium]|nr:DNA polymerase IV [Patescibacteria group bacterium]